MKNTVTPAIILFIWKYSIYVCVKTVTCYGFYFSNNWIFISFLLLNHTIIQNKKILRTHFRTKINTIIYFWWTTKHYVYIKKLNPVWFFCLSFRTTDTRFLFSVLWNGFSCMHPKQPNKFVSLELQELRISYKCACLLTGMLYANLNLS